jgi:2-succinyl-5-enolpyruvyl-6-hydroxy-3-cyclohexene-1-carboxylate synthase
MPNDPELGAALSQFLADYRWPVAGDILSNLHALPSFCGHADTFLGQLPEKLKISFKPDLLITFGKSLVAKNLKLFLRQYSPREHWHLQIGGETADTFKNLSRVLPVLPAWFFEELMRRLPEKQLSHGMYADEWAQHEIQARKSIEDFFKKHDQGEFSLVNTLLRALPERCNLHLANSMSVRYANHIGLSRKAWLCLPTGVLAVLTAAPARPSAIHFPPRRQISL